MKNLNGRKGYALLRTLPAALCNDIAEKLELKCCPFPKNRQFLSPSLLQRSIPQCWDINCHWKNVSEGFWEDAARERQPRRQPMLKHLLQCFIINHVLSSRYEFVLPKDNNQRRSDHRFEYILSSMAMAADYCTR